MSNTQVAQILEIEDPLDRIDKKQEVFCDIIDLFLDKKFYFDCYDTCHEADYERSDVRGRDKKLFHKARYRRPPTNHLFEKHVDGS